MQRIATTLVSYLLVSWMERSQTRTGQHNGLNFGGLRQIVRPSHCFHPANGVSIYAVVLEATSDVPE